MLAEGGGNQWPPFPRGSGPVWSPCPRFTPVPPSPLFFPPSPLPPLVLTSTPPPDSSCSICGARAWPFWGVDEQCYQTGGSTSWLVSAQPPGTVTPVWKSRPIRTHPKLTWPRSSNSHHCRTQPMGAWQWAHARGGQPATPRDKATGAPAAGVDQLTRLDLTSGFGDVGSTRRPSGLRLTEQSGGGRPACTAGLSL